MGRVERRCAGSSLSLSLSPVGDAGSAGGNFSTRPATDVCLRSEAPLAEAARERVVCASGVRNSLCNYCFHGRVVAITTVAVAVATAATKRQSPDRIGPRSLARRNRSRFAGSSSPLSIRETRSRLANLRSLEELQRAPISIVRVSFPTWTD